MVRGLPGAPVVENPPTNEEAPRDVVSISRSRVGNDYSLQYFCLENATDREVWQATVHEVTKSQTPLSTHASNYLNEAKNNSLSRRNPLRTQIPTIQQIWVLLGNSQRQQGIEYHPGKDVVTLHNDPM